MISQKIHENRLASLGRRRKVLEEQLQKQEAKVKDIKEKLDRLNAASSQLESSWETIQKEQEKYNEAAQLVSPNRKKQSLKSDVTEEEPDETVGSEQLGNGHGEILSNDGQPSADDDMSEFFDKEDDDG